MKVQMPVRELDVYLDGTLAGTVTMSAAGALNFAYDEKYRSMAHPTPLSMSMPVELALHKNRVVMPFLQGLLPDNAQALASIAATYSVNVTVASAWPVHSPK
jgi:serine/threonine-protein kinase HipA